MWLSPQFLDFSRFLVPPSGWHSSIYLQPCGEVDNDLTNVVVHYVSKSYSKRGAVVLCFYFLIRSSFCKNVEHSQPKV